MSGVTGTAKPIIMDREAGVSLARTELAKILPIN